MKIYNRFTKELILECDSVDDIPHGANLSCADFSKIDDFRCVDFDRINLFNADIQTCSFAHSSLREANLERANIYLVDFSDAQLSGAWFFRTYASSSRFCRANLSGVCAREANFFASDLSYADLRGAIFEGAYLSGVCLHKALINWASPELLGEILQSLIKDDADRKRFVEALPTMQDESKKSIAKQLLMEFDVKENPAPEWVINL